MGLDNIPHVYPCKKSNTAIMVTMPLKPDNPNGEPLLDDDGKPVQRIDCDATQQAGGCPWHEAAFAEDEKLRRPETGLIIGIFGTDCWYRGKIGNSLIEEYGSYDEVDGQSFYSSRDDDYKSPQECLQLADYLDGLYEETTWMDNPGEMDYLETGIITGPTEDGELLRYAAWWSRWIAEAGDGMDCWW